MVGAGIFSLLGAAGEVAGAAVWLSFLLAGGVAGLQGYSFAKFGARYPSAGGLLEYVAEGFGDGHFTGIIAWLVLATNAIVTGMVAVSFGSYASSALGRTAATRWIKVFAVLIVAGMTLLNVLGSQGGGADTDADRVRGARHPHRVRGRHAGQPRPGPAGLLGLSAVGRHRVAAWRSTFFAFLGFGIVTFTAKDLPNPSPPAAPGDVPGARHRHRRSTSRSRSACSAPLTVEKVIESGGTALAVAAQPVLGQAGYWLMTVTALFATSGATNAGLYPAAGLCEQMAATGQFPPALGRRLGGRAPAGLLITAAIAIVFAVGLRPHLDRLDRQCDRPVVFTLMTVGHLRVRARDRRPHLGSWCWPSSAP